MMRVLEDFRFEGIDEELLIVDQVVSSPYAYEQGLIKVLRGDGTHVVNSLTEALQMGMTYPIKIEGYERLNEVLYKECLRLAQHFNHAGYVSCHLFQSIKGSKSFSMHTDPDDVIVYMVRGRKQFISPVQDLVLEQGQSIFIPRQTLHQAINTDDSIMLSFGLDLFLENKLWA